MSIFFFFGRRKLPKTDKFRVQLLSTFSGLKIQKTQKTHFSQKTSEKRSVYSSTHFFISLVLHAFLQKLCHVFVQKHFLTLSFWNRLEKCVEEMLILEKCIESLQNLKIVKETQKNASKGFQKWKVNLFLEKCVELILRSFFGKKTFKNCARFLSENCDQKKKNGHIRYIKLIERSLLRSCHASANS